MASSSVNNIAAAFSKVAKTSSSSSSSSLSPNQKNSPFSISLPSWNPHATLPKSQRSSLLNFYGPPGPPPTIQLISTVRPCRRMIMMMNICDDNNNNNKQHKSLPMQIGKKVPNNINLSFLNRNGVVQTVSLLSLCKGRKVSVIAVSAAFSPGCSQFVKGVVDLAKAKGSDLIACVAVNDVFVMKAWGENLAVDGVKVMMLSDGRGELAAALDLSPDTTATRGKARLGLGVRSRRFCVNTMNGVITGVDFDEENDGLVSVNSMVV